jgi:tRNA(His) guanylyltransferase
MSELSQGDALGDRMKFYEGLSHVQLLPGFIVCARLDGRNFHAFTKRAKRPFSSIFHAFMISVMRHLVVESCATVGYTQSDEISLAWIDRPFFSGNSQKMCSTLASMASVRLNLHRSNSMHTESFSGLRWDLCPTFDCRVWVVPSRVEAANVFLWRQQDASRNSVQMAARYHFSHKACENLDNRQLQEKLLTEAGVNWNDYPSAFRRGTFVKHVKTRRAFTPEELNELPLKHDARRDPNLVVERRVISERDIDLRGVEDRASVLFEDDTEGP